MTKPKTLEQLRTEKEGAFRRRINSQDEKNLVICINFG